MNSPKVLLIHGPNLGLLGLREPEIYGNRTSEDILQDLQEAFPEVEFSYFQSESESEIILKIQESRNMVSGIIINAAALSHTSIGIADALRATQSIAIGVHISNTLLRQEYRHKDVVAEACKGCIVGLGTQGYILAADCLIHDYLLINE